MKYLKKLCSTGAIEVAIVEVVAVVVDAVSAVIGVVAVVIEFYYIEVVVKVFDSVKLLQVYLRLMK